MPYWNFAMIALWGLLTGPAWATDKRREESENPGLHFENRSHGKNGIRRLWSFETGSFITDEAGECSATRGV